MLFAKSKFRTKMVILAGLEAILGPLGTILGPLGSILGPLGTLLGRSWSFQGATGHIGPSASRPFGGTLGGAQVPGGRREVASLPCRDPPPPPKLIAKAISREIVYS